MSLRSVLGSLQLPVAGIGVLLLVMSISQLLLMESPLPESEGFVQGLAMFFLYIMAWVGLVLTAGGLAIPPGEDGFGIQFNRWQRRLFILAMLGAIGSALLPLVGMGWIFATAREGNGTLLLIAFAGPSGIAIVSLLAGLAWRAAEAIRPRIAIAEG
ncbi:MAG: hypothetical protein SVG88_14640 [Halobacteriales archaeon]|nr:hypothetical protein [Halobacteriales archaeon]